MAWITGRDRTAQGSTGSRTHRRDGPAFTILSPLRQVSYILVTSNQPCRAARCQFGALGEERAPPALLAIASNHTRPEKSCGTILQDSSQFTYKNVARGSSSRQSWVPEHPAGRGFRVWRELAHRLLLSSGNGRVPRRLETPGEREGTDVRCMRTNSRQL